MSRTTPGGHVEEAGLQVHPHLHAFLRDEALPGTGVDEAAFWAGLSELVHDLAPRHRALLARRDELQRQLDRWHRARRRGGLGPDPVAERHLLEEIGYLAPEGEPFQVATEGVDPEVAEVAGPQLVVPATNPRYALNAANARWLSLYDALYGTDALGDPPPPGPYDPARGARVVAWARALLDDVAPLAAGSHADVAAYAVACGELRAHLHGGRTTALVEPGAFVGYRGEPGAPSSVLLRHHGLHLELVVDRAHPVGAADRAGVSDVVVEAAVTAIVDCEDSVATVDAPDKVGAYRTWLGLNRGDLTAEVPAGGTTAVRRLAPDRRWTRPDGSELVLPGRALLLVRAVGLLPTTDAVLDRRGHPVPEGIVDAVALVLCSRHDPSRAGRPTYVVVPKLHGPEEAAFADDLLTRVEDLLGLPRDAVKVGLMDEERRTSANLAECLRALRTRLAFVNTGFLDRTGDEIHTCMEAGPVVRKADMRAQPWLAAYEDRNVAVALACGLAGRAQIGKGMWAAPDLMGAMLAQKQAHPDAGASCAWVPSPTAAALHATHYHRVDVRARQAALAGRPAPPVEELLAVPVAPSAGWAADEVQRELDGNVQGILGYVVRWVDQGVGCSKVPDLDDVALMEDRATCRISSQHVANWLRHGVVGADQVEEALARMAEVVDAQNAGDPAYTPMAPGLDGPAFAAARQLVLHGADQPSGTTELVLHRARRLRKEQDQGGGRP